MTLATDPGVGDGVTLATDPGVGDDVALATGPGVGDDVTLECCSQTLMASRPPHVCVTFPAQVMSQLLAAFSESRLSDDPEQ